MGLHPGILGSWDCDLGGRQILNQLSHPAPQELKISSWVAWVSQLVKHPPLAQVMIPGSWEGALHWASCSAGSPLLSLPLPAAPPACVLSLSLSVK